MYIMICIHIYVSVYILYFMPLNLINYFHILFYNYLKWMVSLRFILLNVFFIVNVLLFMHDCWLWGYTAGDFARGCLSHDSWEKWEMPIKPYCRSFNTTDSSSSNSRRSSQLPHRPRSSIQLQSPSTAESLLPPRICGLFCICGTAGSLILLWSWSNTTAV